jgi:hypothetical protein
MTIREVQPRDFYWFSLVENDYPDLDSTARLLLSLALLLESEDYLSDIPVAVLPPLLNWVGATLLEEKVMTVASWLETAFHLQKQRWDDSIDWLEQQPMSKILLMTSVQGKFCEEQEREMKKGQRRK